MADFLPYARHLIEDDDVAAVAEAMRSGWLTTGPAVAAFEREFARAVEAPHAVACSSGTAGLHLAALALGLAPGDSAVVPSVTFLATANAARYVGAEVTFADVDADTGLLTEATLEEALGRGGRSVKAVFPVHLAGQTVDMAMVARMAAARGLRIVEDACHALGGAYRTAEGGRIAVGSCRHADMAMFSTHPAKAVTTAEGGIVTTRDSALDDRLRRLRNHGMVRDAGRFTERSQALAADGRANPWYYEMPEPGFNYRASDLHCALGLSQLRKLGRFLARRRALALRYDRALAPLAPVVRPGARLPGAESGWHLYTVLIDFARAGLDRVALMRALEARGIGTQVHYLPVHRQPYYRGRYGALELPGADAYYARTLSLPLFPAMADTDVDRVAAALAEVLDLASAKPPAEPGSARAR
ncbi:MAG: UDP-4-amino-4,6-dideoxy-N-acetyl-beta-L-altrosamine transaminase [Alphaproteobacteria bacterium]